MVSTLIFLDVIVPTQVAHSFVDIVIASSFLVLDSRDFLVLIISRMLFCYMIELG